MGGRLARGADGGGVISPYPFGSPPIQPPMTQYGQGVGLPPGAMMALGAGVGAGVGSEQQGHRRNPSGGSSGNYPASLGTTNNGTPGGAYFGMPGRTSYDGPGGGGYQGDPGQFGHHFQGQQQYPQGQGQSQGQLQPPLSPTNTTSSGYANSQGVNPYAPPIGRGPSPGPSVGQSDTVSQSQYSTSSAVGGGTGGIGVGRSAKEIEAFGGLTLAGGGMMMGMPTPHVVNPDDRQDGPLPTEMPQPGYLGVPPITSGVQNYYNPSGGSSAGASSSAMVQSSTSKPGLITLAPSPSMTRPLVQHRDAGRVEENPEVSSEIPPAYDSLPEDVRR